MENIKLEGQALEDYLKNRFGEDYKEKLKPTDEQLKGNYMALFWCICHGETTIEHYIATNGSKRKREHMTGVKVDEALRHFKLKE